MFHVSLYILESEPKCKVHVDLGFLLDSSGSLKNDYHMEKNFLKAMVGSFGLGGKSHAGVITFSHKADHSIKLKDHTDIVSFNRAVDKIKLMGYTTRIDLALRMAKEELFKESSAKKKLLILLTDGRQTETGGYEEPSKIAEELRKDGITIYVVGIGTGIDRHELERIDKKVFVAETWSRLTSTEFTNEVQYELCVGKLFYSHQGGYPSHFEITLY